MIRLIKFTLLFIFINGCGYPDIDDIPNDLDLEVTYEDKENILEDGGAGLTVSDGTLVADEIAISN